MPPNELFLGIMWPLSIIVMLVINYLVMMPWLRNQHAKADQVNKSGLGATFIYWAFWAAFLLIELFLLLSWQAVAYGW